MNREEALKAMIDGKKIRHDQTIISHMGYYFYRQGAFFRRDSLSKNLGEAQITYLSSDAGYYVFEPKTEPKFKEVTMYAPVLDFTKESEIQRPLMLGDQIYHEAPKALRHQKEVVGYTEVKVFLKEDE